MEAFQYSKLLAGSKAMREALCQPDLDHFSLISERLMMAHFKPRLIPYTSLLTIGASVLMESKRAFLFDWYFSMLPSLLANKMIKTVCPKYIDTGTTSFMSRIIVAENHGVCIK